jgi:hypothetical protein
MDKKGIIKHKEVFEAWLEGKEIQVFNTILEKWEECPDPEFWENNQYRIKPENKIIPFTEETIVPHLDRWIMDSDENKYKIINYCDSGISVIDEFYFYHELLKFVFVDNGKPCGYEIN